MNNLIFVARLNNYFKMDTCKIDVSNISAKEASEIIFKHIATQNMM